LSVVVVGKEWFGGATTVAKGKGRGRNRENRGIQENRRDRGIRENITREYRGTEGTEEYWSTGEHLECGIAR